MRICIASERVPFALKPHIVDRGRKILDHLDMQADDTPVESEYGTKFVAGQDDSMGNFWLRVRGVSEPVLSEFILRHVQPGDVCVDAGANIGYFSVLLANRVGHAGRVIAIEAAPDTARRLRANVRLNNADQIVHVVEAACAAEAGSVRFHLHPTIDRWSRLSPPAEGDPDRLYMGDHWIPVTVPAGPLSTLVGDEVERVSFIKLDVEGAEAELTGDIADSFTHPELVLALEARAPISTVLQPFVDKGFHVYDLHNDYRWPYERHVPAITAATCDDFRDSAQADVLVSRRQLQPPGR